MKKYLSLILAVMMVLSCVSYAAPVAVGTVSSANEAEVEVSDLFTAEVAEETEATDTTVKTDLAFETHVFGISFDKMTEWKNDSIVSTIADVYNIPAQFPEGVAFKLGISSGAGSIVAKEEGSTDMVLHCTPTSGYSRWYLQTTSTAKILPNGTYRVSLEMKKDSTVVKNPNTNIYGVKGSNYPIIDAGIKATNTFATFETSFVYERGVTGKWHDTDKNANTGEDGKEHFATDAIGFQTYMNNENVTWDVDNINIYYMPEYVNVDFNGYGKIPADIKVLKNGNFVPAEYVPANVPDTKEAFLGWSFTEDGELVTEPFAVTEDIALYAVYSAKSFETTSKYGKLAYFADFDVTDVKVFPTGKGTAIAELTSVKLDAIEGMPAEVKIESYGSTDADAQGYYLTDGDNLIVTKDGTYPRWFMTAYDGTKLSTFPAGIYTLEWSSTTDHSSATTNSFVINGTDTSKWPTSNLGSVKTMNNSVNNYREFVGTVVYDGEFAYKEDGTVVSHGGSNHSTDLSAGLARIGVYCQSSVTTAKRYYDWAKLWYAPLNIELSYNASGKDVTVPETATVSSMVDFTKLPKLNDCGTSRFVGWTDTPDGEVIVDGTITYSENTTLYAVWDDGYYAEENEDLNAGKLLAHIHFNNLAASISNLNSQMANYGIVNDDFVVNHTSGKTYPDIIYSDESNNAYITQHPANIWLGVENGRYLYKSESGSITNVDNAVVLKAVKTEAVTKFYPKLQLVNNARGTFRDGVYTFVAQVTVEDDENIDKVGYTAFANGVATGLKYINAGESTYVKASMIVLNGALYDYETMTKMAALGPQITNVGFNFDFVMKEATLESPEITADNFRIYYKPYDAAPKAYTENSIRVVNPAGIRFRASVSTLERENAKLTEYGFIVTLDKLLKNASVDKNDFTHESGVRKVEGKNYDKANNVDKIFETQGNYSFFTAVIYNIPENQYKENLVVRPFALVDGKYVYGDAMERNIYDVAQQLKDANGADYATYKDAIDNILAEKAI